MEAPQVKYMARSKVASLVKQYSTCLEPNREFGNKKEKLNIILQGKCQRKGLNLNQNPYMIHLKTQTKIKTHKHKQSILK